MKRVCSLLSALFIGLAVPLAGTQADSHMDKPARAALGAAAAIATVQDIDQETRTVILRNPDGNLTTFVAGDEVRNLAQVKKGDVVLVEYYEGLAVALGPKGHGIRERLETLEATRAELGDKPAASVTTTLDVTATVEAVDQETRMVTLRGAKRTVRLKVADDLDLTQVKVGDEVTARYVESFAVAVVPSPEVSGTVKIESKSIALGIGIEWGQGTLTMYDGSEHNFKIRGLSIVDIGISKLELTGEVFQLTDPQNFAGNYVSAEAGGALVGGGSSSVLRNRQGVVMRLTSTQKGVKLTLAGKGLNIQLAE